MKIAEKIAEIGKEETTELQLLKAEMTELQKILFMANDAKTQKDSGNIEDAQKKINTALQYLRGGIFWGGEARTEKEVISTLEEIKNKIKDLKTLFTEENKEAGAEINELITQAETCSAILDKLGMRKGGIQGALEQSIINTNKIEEAVTLINAAISQVINLEKIIKQLIAKEIALSNAAKSSEGKGTLAATKVYAMSKRFLNSDGATFNLFSPITKPEYAWNDYDKVFMKVFFPKGANTLYLIHTTSSKYVYKNRDAFDKIKPKLAIFFMYLNPQLFVDLKTIISSLLILQSHAIYFATKVQHELEPDDNAATLLITEIEIDKFNLRNKLKRFQPNEPNVWSLSADDINNNKAGKYNLMSYMVKETNNYFRYNIDAKEEFVRQFMKTMILYRLKNFIQDKEAQKTLFAGLTYLTPLEINNTTLNQNNRETAIKDRTASTGKRLSYALTYLAEFVRQGYISEKEFNSSFEESIMQKISNIWDSMASHFHIEKTAQISSANILKKIELEHKDYLKELFKKNIFDMMLSYYTSIYPEDENKAKVLVYLKFEEYFKIADAIRKILANRINDRWKVISGEEITFNILYESLYRYGTPALLLNYYAGLKKREQEFKKTFNFDFPSQLSQYLINTAYPEVYETLKINREDPIIQCINGELKRTWLKILTKFEDLHCLNYLFDMPKTSNTHQKEIIFTLLNCFKKEILPEGKDLKIITDDKVIFPKQTPFTTCLEQGFDTSNKSVYGIAKKFLQDQPKYLELITRLETLYNNILKFEVESNRNYYLDIKTIRSTTLDQKMKLKMRKIYDKSYEAETKKYSAGANSLAA